MKKSSIKALSDGFTDGGVGNTINFPGFFSHNISANLNCKKISINERVAFEVAYGVSLSGKRSLVTMKNVGLNVAADPFLHSLLSGVNGGLVIVITEDVEVTASQERQDSRHYYNFFGGLWFEPSSLKSAYDIARRSFYLSEKYDVPIVIRLTNQFFNLHDNYVRLNKIKYKQKKIIKNPDKYIIYPNYWEKQYFNLKQKNNKIINFTEEFLDYLPQKSIKNNTKGLIMAGNCWKEYSIKKYNEWDKLLIETYSIPAKKVQKFIEGKKEIVVLEQGASFVYEKVSRLISKKNSELSILSNTGSAPNLSSKWIVWNNLYKLFIALKSIGPSFVVGDVGQFTVESVHVINSCLCLGSAVGTGIGLVLGGIKYPFCITGDTSFLHSGIQALIEAQSRNIAMGVIVIDNDGSASTGGQKLISSIYDVNKNIVKITIDYSKTSKTTIKDILTKMQVENKLAILYVKI